MDVSGVWEDCRNGKRGTFWDWAEMRGTPARYVYVLGPVGGPYKVGVSFEPQDRLEAVGAPGDKVWGAIHTDHPFAVEAAAHRALVNGAIGREWFRCTLAEAVSAVENAIEIVAS